MEYIYNSPIGNIYIKADENYILSVSFHNGTDKIYHKNKVIEQAIIQLEEYFAHKRTKFNLPINPIGTEFQKKVWNELIKIPYGETKTYKQIAIAVGSDKLSRAIGNANNKNPIGIIIPCHRVIGSNGKLTGYAGGLDKKQKLLELEKSFKK